ncbi:hypothetical protein PHACT_12650 [Pseudohongiella acticola]|uniref:Uncharacterized protein n=1 Tax=Pseudohongiella acticola TaxID=1524254 RepID=A0A1E8CG09_9GAMM|nr:DUF968 domain-containing protein [Pseudohongiella acticola]OFE11400.1 hypothetical protein PHACT_12650 [Pseudohongiella acticola]
MARSTKQWKRIPKDEKKAIEKYHALVAEMACVVTGKRPVTLHHCHGGSLADIGITRGMSQRPSDWLVIPIIMDLHVGPQGIDGGKGVRSWEAEHGAQLDHLIDLQLKLGIDLFTLAGYDWTRHVEKGVPS